MFGRMHGFGSGEPVELYALYLSRGLAARAKRFREEVRKDVPFDMELYFDRLIGIRRHTCSKNGLFCSAEGAHLPRSMEMERECYVVGLGGESFQAPRNGQPCGAAAFLLAIMPALYFSR